MPTQKVIASDESEQTASAFERLGAVIAGLLLALARKRAISIRDQRVFRLRVEREIERTIRRAERTIMSAIDTAVDEAVAKFPGATTDLTNLRAQAAYEMATRLRGATNAASERASTRLSALIMRRIAWGLQTDEPGESIADSITNALEGRRRQPNIESLVQDISEQKYYRDAAGRNWRLNTYAEMVIRTNAARVHNEAVRALAADAGIDLVRVTTSASACSEVCTDYQGRIYSLSGTDRRYPQLTRTPPFHPNCVHRLEPVAADAAAG